MHPFRRVHTLVVSKRGKLPSQHSTGSSHSLKTRIGTMELMLSNSFHENGFSSTRLPSWDQPILAPVWRHIRHMEDEMDHKFPLPKTSSDFSMENLSDEDDGPFFISSQYVDQDDILPLWRKATHEHDERSHSEQSESSTMEEDDDDDEESCMSDSSFEFDSDDLEHRADQSEKDSSAEGEHGRRSSEVSFDSMNVDEIVDTQPDREPQQFMARQPPPIAWIIEAGYISTKLSFKLKIAGGAYMLLLEEEVMESVQVLLEETLNRVFFKVQTVNGDSTVVDSSQVLDVVSEIIASESDQRDRENQNNRAGRMIEGVSSAPVPQSQPKIQNIQSQLARHRRNPRPKDCKARKSPIRFRSAWRALSGRAKVRPPVRME
jgi:hypothetical protein